MDTFRCEIYDPLVEELGIRKQKLVENASVTALATAVQRGRVSFDRGLFTGRFTAEISRQLKNLGATWDNSVPGWRLPMAELPLEVRMAISMSDSRFSQVLRRIDERLSRIVPAEIADVASIQKSFERTVWKVDRDVDKTIKGLAIKPKLTPAQAERVASDYTRDLERYIQKWAADEILQLREKVQQQAFRGYRYEALAKTIQTSYGVSQNKAKFLARQETNLLMTTFKQVRYQDAGVDEYLWFDVGGTAAHPVRPMHKALAARSKKGETFRFSDPPVTNPQGQRNNPGQDFNCRCYARPVVKF